MEYFILHYTWCILTFIKYCGIYPCRRVENAIIKPNPAYQYWIVYLSSHTLVITFACLSFFNISLQESKVESVIYVASNIVMPKAIDKIAVACNLTIITVLHLITTIRLMPMVNHLAKVQEYVNSNAIIDLKQLKRPMIEMYIRIVPFFIIVFTAAISIFFGLLSQLKAALCLSFCGTVFAIIAFSILQFYLFLPILYFVFVFAEVTVLFKNWSDCLVNQQPHGHIIEDVKSFYDGLKMISGVYSPFLFWIISCLFLSEIIFAYVSIIHIQELFYNIYSTLFWEKFIHELGYFCTVLYISYLLFVMCTISEAMSQKVQKLKSFLQDHFYLRFESDTVCSMLDDFKGFNANGYFTLNNSLLTGMTAGLATFLVILIQFNQSESDKQLEYDDFYNMSKCTLP